MQNDAAEGNAIRSPSLQEQESKEISPALVATSPRSKKQRRSRTNEPGSSKKAARPVRSLQDADHVEAGGKDSTLSPTTTQGMHKKRGADPSAKEPKTTPKLSEPGSVQQPSSTSTSATEPSSPHSNSSRTATQSPASIETASQPGDVHRIESPTSGTEIASLGGTGQTPTAERKHRIETTQALSEAAATTASGAHSATHETASRNRQSDGGLMPAPGLTPATVTGCSAPRTSSKGHSQPTSIRDAGATHSATEGGEAPNHAAGVKTTKTSKRDKADIFSASGQPSDHAPDCMLTLCNATCGAAVLGDSGVLCTGSDPQPETGLRDMATLPSLLERLLEPFRKRAHFGSVTLKVLSPSTSLSHSPVKTEPSTIAATSRWPLVAVALVLALVLVLVAYLLFHSVNGGDKPGTGPRLCQTSDCHWHASLFSQRFNQSIDPCDDFGAFVCSAWTASSSKEASTREEVVMGFLENFEGMLTGVQTLGRHLCRTMPVAKRALEMYRACMDPTAYNDQSREVIRTFMADQGVSWPRQSRPPSSPASPLRIIIRFALRWQLPLWFSVRLLTTARGRRAVFLTDNPKMLGWAAIHRRLLANNSTFDYWMQHHEALSRRGETGADNTDARSESEKDSKLQESIFHILLEEREGKIETGAMFPLSKIEEYATSALPSGEWLQELNEHVTTAGEPNLSGATHVALTDVALLAALGRLWEKHSRAELVEALSWLLAQIIGPIADIRLLRLRTGSSAGAETLLRHFCVAQVEDIYRVLVIAVSTIVKFPQHLRRDINSRLAQVQKTALALIGSLKLLDSTTRVRVKKQLSGTNTLLWPAHDLLTAATLSVLYANFPTGYSEAAKTFAALWLRSRQALYDLETDPVYMDAADMPANMALPLVEYDNVRHTVRVSIQALSWPVYYAQGTNAMFYGGLGFLYATELVKSIDTEGMTLDLDGNEEGSWTSDVWRNVIADRTSCMTREGTDGSNEGRGGSLFPYTPALEVAYAALREAVAEDTRPVHVLEAYTEQQLFFITLCYLMCGAAHSGSRDCNKALRHFPPFAQHFRCDQGSKMRADQQCPFLYTGYSEEQGGE